MIDLRSDTVTRPSAGMRRAMAEAEVGDDVLGEDPTTILLQDTIAEMLGKEAALFVPSGTMGNQLGIHTQTTPGDEVIVEQDGHIFNYESGAAGSLSGVTLHVIRGKEGRFNTEQFLGALRHGHYWESRSTLLCLENTLNRAGGRLFPLQELRKLTECAHEHGLACHLDGARLWNASVATKIPVMEYAKTFDTVTVCLSKGLGAPVGSVFAGTKKIIQKARRRRKELGAGMRQSGILAAAGLYALKHHVPGLEQDHTHAMYLAERLASLPSLHVPRPQTNIVLLHLLNQKITVSTLLKRLRSRGVAMTPIGTETIRANTHRNICREELDVAIAAVEQSLN